MYNDRNFSTLRLTLAVSSRLNIVSGGERGVSWHDHGKDVIRTINDKIILSSRMFNGIIVDFVEVSDGKLSPAEGKCSHNV